MLTPGSIPADPDFNRLDENERMLLGNLSDKVYIYDKQSHETLCFGEFSGVPACGKISRQNDWCVVGGSELVLKSLKDQSLRAVNGLNDIFDLRMTGPHLCEILTNPRVMSSAIWELEVDVQDPGQVVSLKKVRNFREYVNAGLEVEIRW